MKTLRSAALAAIALGTVAASAPASAQYYHRHGWNPGAAAAVGVLGGLAIGGAIAANARPYPAPAPVYGPPPVAYGEDCYVERRRVWVPGWGWEVRRQTVCY
jgi:hypothetical protein